MSEGQPGSYAKSGSRRSSRGSKWRERRQKRCEDREPEEEGQSGLGEGSFQTYRTMFGALGRNRFDRRDDELEQRDKELERLRRLVRDLELETRGRHQRRDRDDREGRSDSGGNRYGAGSNRFDSCQRRDCSHSQEFRQDRSHSWEYADRGLDSPEERRPGNAAMDAMSCALRRVAQSPFLNNIERALMLSRFMHPPFNSYDGKTNLVEHVSHYIQMMSLHTHNDALMCKVFPLSLGPTALRWFNGLRKGSIHSFAKLIQEFGVRFVTCSWVLQLVDALLSMKMRVRETLRNYASRYW